MTIQQCARARTEYVVCAFPNGPHGRRPTLSPLGRRLAQRLLPRRCVGRGRRSRWTLYRKVPDLYASGYASEHQAINILSYALYCATAQR